MPFLNNLENFLYYINQNADNRHPPQPTPEELSPPAPETPEEKRIALINALRRLWIEHVLWTRNVILSTASDSPDLDPTVARLLRNPEDFALTLLPFYGAQHTAAFKTLFTEHLTIAGDLLAAHKAHDLDKALALRDRWYKNAEDLSELMSSINPFWDEEEFQNMMALHLGLTEDEMLYRLDGQYEDDIRQFDIIEDQALKMADMMSYGLIQQFEI